MILNAYYDVIPRLADIPAGNSPGLMAISPSRNVVAAFDASSNSVYGVDTTSEADIGPAHLAGPTKSMVIPTSAAIGYAAVPTATFQGFSFIGAVEVMNFSAGGVAESIAVTNAQTVISNSSGTQLLVFSNDSNSVTVLTPGAAVSPVDTSCLTNPPNAVCTIVSGFDHPVYGVINGTTAYILNCGAQCGGIQASVMVLRPADSHHHQNDSRRCCDLGAPERNDAVCRRHLAHQQCLHGTDDGRHYLRTTRHHRYWFGHRYWHGCNHRWLSLAHGYHYRRPALHRILRLHQYRQREQSER